MNENWDKWEKRIQIELSASKWITVNDVRDMAEIFGIPLSGLEIVFAKYASTHPEQVNYGYLNSGDDFGNLVNEYKVLVKKDSDLGKYYLD